MGGRAKRKPFGGAFREAKYEKTRRGRKAGVQKFPCPRPLSFFARPLFWGARGLCPRLWLLNFLF